MRVWVIVRRFGHVSSFFLSEKKKSVCVSVGGGGVAEGEKGGWGGRKVNVIIGLGSWFGVMVLSFVVSQCVYMPE